MKKVLKDDQIFIWYQTTEKDYPTKWRAHEDVARLGCKQFEARLLESNKPGDKVGEVYLVQTSFFDTVEVVDR